METGWGGRIREARKGANLTQEALAVKVGVADKSVVSRWENERQEPDFTTIAAIARATGKHPSWFFAGATEQSELGPTVALPDRPAWVDDLERASLEGGRIAAAAIKQQEDHFVAAVEAQRQEYNELLRGFMATQTAMLDEIRRLREDVRAATGEVPAVHAASQPEPPTATPAGASRPKDAADPHEAFEQGREVGRPREARPAKRGRKRGA